MCVCVDRLFILEGKLPCTTIAAAFVCSYLELFLYIICRTNGIAYVASWHKNNKQQQERALYAMATHTAEPKQTNTYSMHGIWIQNTIFS